MRTLARAGALMCVLSIGVPWLPLGAAEILYTITPQSLGAWSTQGVDKVALMQARALSLPAGAQLSRKFPEGAVILRLVSHPVFSEASSDWPLLEIGPVVVGLISQAGQGRLVSVIDGAKAEILPWTISLSGNDNPCELMMAYDPVSGAVFIKFKDQMQVFDASPSADPVEVWLSAGAKSAWPLDSMEVLLLTAENNSDTPKTTVVKSTEPVKLINRLKSAGKDLLGWDKDKPGFNLDGTKSDIVAAQTEAVSTLEVFTPPSVRRARTETIRSIVAKSQDK